MCKVDKSMDTTLVDNLLNTPRNDRKALERFHNCIYRYSMHLGSRCGKKGVVDIEETPERKNYFSSTPRERTRAKSALEILHLVSRHAYEALSYEVACNEICQPRTPRVINIDNCGTSCCRTEKFRFCEKIVFHRAVKIKMIMPKIGKNTCSELHTSNTLQLQRMGSNFHHNRLRTINNGPTHLSL